jgi:flavin-dependent dehydrogenase
MLIGDAGGLVDPITREGIFFALASGEAAADSLDAADPGPAYAARIRESIHHELRRAARLKTRFFERRFTALLVRALQRSPRIRAVMADLVAGEQPYRGLRRRLLRTFELRLMWDLFTSRDAGV